MTRYGTCYDGFESIHCEDGESDYTHFYLYAKGHYQKAEDLRVIAGHKSLVEPQNIRQADVIAILLKLVFRHITTEHLFEEFIIHLTPMRIWI